MDTAKREYDREYNKTGGYNSATRRVERYDVPTRRRNAEEAANVIIDDFIEKNKITND
jgi:hypothetical protein